jgi:hypothetical protein
MTDEEYVRAHWEFCSTSRANSLWGVHVGSRGELTLVPHPLVETEPDAWAAAAEFTRERLEQIRQLEEEITQIQCDIVRASKEADEWQSGGMDVLASSWNDTEWCYSRILARLESALADLRQGMNA